MTGDETLTEAIAAAIARYEEGGGADVWRGAARAAVAAVRAAGWVPADEKRNDGGHHAGTLIDGMCQCECDRCWRDSACMCRGCTAHFHDHTERDRRDAQATS